MKGNYTETIEFQAQQISVLSSINHTYSLIPQALSGLNTHTHTRSHSRRNGGGGVGRAGEPGPNPLRQYQERLVRRRRRGGQDRRRRRRFLRE